MSPSTMPMTSLASAEVKARGEKRNPFKLCDAAGSFRVNTERRCVWIATLYTK